MATSPSSSANAAGPNLLNDPEGEVWLETEDKEILRVRAYNLQAHSVVFRDMLAIPEGKPATEESPIPISATKEEFRALLAFAGERNVEEWTRWPTMGRVYELAEIYDFPAVRGRLVNRIALRAEDFPWETFVFGAQKNLPLIAKRAIWSKYGETNALVRQHHTLPAKEGARVPAAYLIPYVRLLPDTAKDSNFWAAAGNEFAPRA